MGKQDKKTKSIAPSLSPAAREQTLVSLAYNLAEQQILDGTASSQIITHFLKQGSRREELEMENLGYKNELTKAKTDDLTEQRKTRRAYEDAMKAFKAYQGGGEDNDEEL